MARQRRENPSTGKASGGGSFNFLTDQRVSALTPYNSLKGDSTAQTSFAYASVNVFQKYVSAGYSKFGAGNTAAEGVWYNDDVDLPVATQLFQKIRNNVRGRIPYDIDDVQCYLASVGNIIARYTHLLSHLDQLNEDHGHLGEVNQALEALNPQMFGTAAGGTTNNDSYVTSLAESRAMLELVQRSVGHLSFSPVLQSEIQEIYKYHRSDDKPDAPLLGFVPVQACGWSSTGSNIITRPAIPALLWRHVQEFLERSDMIKISADLETTFGGGWALNLPMSVGKATFNADWLDIWGNSGWVFDDGNTTDPNDSMVPNASNAAESARYMIPYQFISPPSAMKVRNLAWGRGDTIGEIRGYHLANYWDVTFGTEDLDHSNHGTFAYAYYANDPTGTAAPSRFEVDTRIVWPATLWTKIADFEPEVRQLQREAMFARGALGWARVAQAVNSTTLEDQYEGISQLTPYMGEKHYIEPFTLQKQALDLYLDAYQL